MARPREILGSTDTGAEPVGTARVPNGCGQKNCVERVGAIPFQSELGPFRRETGIPATAINPSIVTVGVRQASASANVITYL